MLEHVESFLLESNSGESQNFLSQSRYICRLSNMGVTAPFCIT